MPHKPAPAITLFEDTGHLATTQTVIPVTIHLTASLAARLLTADYGRVILDTMGPAERARALTQAVEARCLIDTTEADVHAVRTSLINDMATPTPKDTYDGSTTTKDVPTVFTDKPTGTDAKPARLQAMQTVTK